MKYLTAMLRSHAENAHFGRTFKCGFCAVLNIISEYILERTVSRIFVGVADVYTGDYLVVNIGGGVCLEYPCTIALVSSLRLVNFYP